VRFCFSPSCSSCPSWSMPLCACTTIVGRRRYTWQHA